MLQEVIIVAKFGEQYIDSCLESLGDKYPVFVMDTSEGGHPSGAVMFQPKFPEMQGKGHEVIELSRLDDVPIGAPAVAGPNIRRVV